MVKISDLKVGDHVLIVDHRTTASPLDTRGSWNPQGEMDKRFGTVMTVRKVVGNAYVNMEEDRTEWCGTGWNWYPWMIECVVDDAPFEPAPESDLMALLFGGDGV